MLGRKSHRRDNAPRPTKGLARFHPLMDTGMLLLGVGLVLSFSYLAWVILSGGLASRLIADSEITPLQNSLETGRSAFATCLWLLLILAMVRHYKNEGISLLAVAAGLLCWFGMPLMIGKFCPSDAAVRLQQMAQGLMADFHSMGGALIVVGLLRFLVGRIVIMTYQPPGAMRPACRAC